MATTFRSDRSAGEITVLLRAAHDDGDPERLLAQRLYPALDADGTLTRVVTRHALIHADPGDHAPLVELATTPVTAHSDETLRALTNRMASTAVTRLLIITRDEHPRAEGIVSLRDLLTARGVDLHDEHHAERVFTLRRRSPAPATT